MGFSRAVIWMGLAALLAGPIARSSAVAEETVDAAGQLRAIGAHVFADAKSGKVTEVSANSNSKIDDSHLRLIATFPDITDLSLERTRVGDGGVHHLVGLRKLEWLNLFQTSVGDEGLEQLSKIASLKLLPIGGTRVSDAGLKHVKEMGQLEYLGLRGNAITDAGLMKLSSLTNLEELWLAGTEVDPATVEQLQQQLPKLVVDGPASAAISSF